MQYLQFNTKFVMRLHCASMQSITTIKFNEIQEAYQDTKFFMPRHASDIDIM